VEVCFAVTLSSCPLGEDRETKLTQIDYDREIALVAIDEESETDSMLGVARIIGDADGKTGEFAVLAGDAWKGQGIGLTCWKNAFQSPKSKALKPFMASS
jgi:acetyltransferase